MKVEFIFMPNLSPAYHVANAPKSMNIKAGKLKAFREGYYCCFWAGKG